MILVTDAIVLARRSLREYDRMTVLYTRTQGRLTARFVGVDRPKGKLKALSEPMVYGEYRLYLRPEGRTATVTGGRLVDTFPRLRSDLARTTAGLWMCELLLRLTPEAAPSELKFELLRDHLFALERAPSPWLTISFGLRLMRLAGFGLGNRGVSPGDLDVWERLQEQDVLTLSLLPEDAMRLGRLCHIVEHAAEYEINGMLNTRRFREALSPHGFNARRFTYARDSGQRVVGSAKETVAA